MTPFNSGRKGGERGMTPFEFWGGRWEVGGAYDPLKLCVEGGGVGEGVLLLVLLLRCCQCSS